MSEFKHCKWISGKRKCVTVLLPEEEASGFCDRHQDEEKLSEEKTYNGASGRKFRYYLRKTHKMSLEEYNKHFDLQEGRCAACKMTDNRRLAVDAEEGVGLYGLLCNKCDLIARNLRKNPSMLRYIEAKLASRV